MSNYRAYKATIVSGSTALGEGSPYPKCWAIMIGENVPTGSVALAGGGVVNFATIGSHNTFQCYPIGLTITSGALVVLE